ncbi:efflux RND transporter periplasmic adaptor subunit [Acidithiobacillus sp. AMEEHan]|uniref:efflux RND transporter periplasmic adaptor subunit n=1 Tax=Acidithiobacillus sp. AMEEHan TaxID=2994951 RepID=UPI0027E59ECB|nr:efflux RND transporter periplasmic adaptor subunit [Acidithiobacillus sp. AMEEHan]
MNWQRALQLTALTALVGLASLAGNAAPSALVQISPVQSRLFTHTLRAYGTVAFASQAAHLLSARCESVVQQVLVVPGEKVRKGQLLLRLSASPAEQLQVEQAKIDLRFAQNEWQRQSDLRQRQLATNAQVQSAAQNLAKAKALLQSLEQRQQSLQGGAIRAPIAGVITAVPVQAGNTVAAGQSFLTINPASARVVALGVEPQDLAEVHPGAKVVLRSLEDRGRSWSAKVQQVLAQVDPNTRLAGVIVPLPADAQALPGTLLSGEITLAQQQSLAIPDSAVLREHGRSYCFVDAHGIAQKRWIETGWQEGKWIEVRHGLHAGEAVVSLGNYELQEGMSLRLEGKS